jgi:hypothetical protein
MIVALDWASRLPSEIVSGVIVAMPTQIAPVSAEAIGEAIAGAIPTQVAPPSAAAIAGEVAKLLPTPVVAVVPTVASTQVSAQAVAQQPQGCGKAADLGPWAPVNGVGETFEVTCNENVCSGTHVQLWWPGGSGQVWDKKEISVLIPSGLSIEVEHGAGRGWEYPLGCSLEEIQRQILADNSRRSTDTAFYGQVKIDDLIKTGLVVVRFDRRSAPLSK